MVTCIESVLFVLVISFVQGVFDVHSTSCFACYAKMNPHEIFEDLILKTKSLEIQ